MSIGRYGLLTFLETSGVKIHTSVDDVTRVGREVVSGEMHYEDLLEWILDIK